MKILQLTVVPLALLCLSLVVSCETTQFVTPEGAAFSQVRVLQDRKGEEQRITLGSATYSYSVDEINHDTAGEIGAGYLKLMFWKKLFSFGSGVASDTANIASDAINQ